MGIATTFSNLSRKEWAHLGFYNAHLHVKTLTLNPAPRPHLLSLTPVIEVPTFFFLK